MERKSDGRPDEERNEVRTSWAVSKQGEGRTGYVAWDGTASEEPHDVCCERVALQEKGRQEEGELE